MASRDIKFDSYDLQNGNISIREIEFESISNRRINYQKIPGRDGAKFVDDDYDPRIIRMRGSINDSSGANLDTRIDELSEVLIRQNKPLDIDYISGTRRYTANCTNFILQRDFYNITHNPIELEFTVSNPPWAKALDSTTSSWDNLIGTSATTATIEDTTGGGAGKAVYFGGTRRPLPKLQFIINTCSSLERIKFTNESNSDAIGVSREFSAGETLVVDCDNLTVQVDGTDVDYDGVFPEFTIGWNNFTVDFVARAYNVTLNVVYYKLWI